MSDDHPSLTLVRTDDLLAVLAVVPPWVPMGWHGDSQWTHESLNAKDRLLNDIRRQGVDGYEATDEEVVANNVVERLRRH